ncbi:MAG: RlmE family RNA methyltransferase [Candidatus Bathyarchaeota archaeon]|nr:RlmE family RNA methyltransferase [Candidatus Bathyarchaeota archaeon]MDH5494241.1 RlmE family RNA methyltransferase [Candidatus Bathyarchaeota archaeon]
MPKAWVRERKRDYYFRKAKEEKYRSRATYKLLQAVKKYRFLRKGDVVVDLGAAPGGWLQASRKIVGKAGFVLGVDLKSIDPLKVANVHTITGDITDSEISKQIERILPSLVDAVISDVSPNVSGVWEVDHARQIDLARQSLTLALKFLKANGNFFVKVFQGDMFKGFVEEVREHFARVEIMKPKASRAKSAEIFVLGMGLKKDK